MVKIKKIKRGWIGGKTQLTLTSPFGINRRVSRGRVHNGIDISVPQGTSIYAPVSGKLTCRKQVNGAGLYLMLDNNGFRFYFMHLSSAVISVNGSKTVKEGDLIGKSGGKAGDSNSGHSTGPHLHFEVRRGNYGKNDAINPLYFISDEIVGKVKGNVYCAENVNIPKITENNNTDDYYVNVSDYNIQSDRDNDISDQVDINATEVDDKTEYEVEEGLAAGIWQITKLLLDANVADLRIHDAAVSIQAGSLISFFNKVCQQPFVEFMGDTFGDQYCFIVRKPPFDREGMLKTITAQGLFGESKGDNIYDINSEDIISSNISFNSNNIYSWYQLYPMYTMGASSDIRYIVPAVLFPEYASIWGSRELVIRSQYRSFDYSSIIDEINDKNKSAHADSEILQSIYDLKYIIESNAYSPFVRNGTIRIVGNRRIKRGTFVRVNWPNFSEIFYVESVGNNYSISNNTVDRATSLILSHGMVENFMFLDNKIIESEGTKKVLSYFNLIDFGGLSETNKVDMDTWPTIISKWKVNIDIFKFFLKKMQFITNINQGIVVNN
jgi:hypothetical protein